MALLITSFIAFFVFIVNPTLLRFASAVLVVLLVWFGKRERLAINPFLLFLTTPISLLLYSDSVSAIFLPTIDLSAQLVIILGVYAYFAGLLTIKIDKNWQPKKYEIESFSFMPILILGLIPHFLGLLNAGAPMLANDVNLAKSRYILPIIGQFTIFLPVTILIAFYKRNKFLIFLSMVLNAVFSIIIASKFHIFFNAIFFAFAYFRYNGKEIFKINPVYLIVGSVAAIPFVFEAIFSVRDSTDQTVYFWRNEAVFEWDFLNNFGDYTYLPYLYLTSPWSNFSYIFDLSPPFSFGAKTIYSIASVFQLDGLLSASEKMVRMPQFNTHAYITDFYLDFGVIGVVFLSYLLGVVVKWSYKNSIKRRDVLSEGVWISFGFASFLLFFSNHFTGQSYPLLTLLLFGIYRFFSRVIKFR